MSPTTVFTVLVFSLLIPPRTASATTATAGADQSFISVVITQNGLDFVKDLLISKAISTLTPLQLPKIEKTVKIPVIGKVHIVLSDITINHVDVGSSHVKPGDTGVSIVGSDATCDLSMNWHYSYGTWLVPISVSDSGSASVQVNGMEIGLTLGLENQEGSLKISVLECGCYVNSISIDLDGGASWLYQGVVDAFEKQIASAVEKAITKKLKSGVSKLGSFLQTLPKQVSVDDNASLNVTVVNDPFLSDNSLGIEINGLFIESKSDAVTYHNALQPSVSCSDPSKMVGISLDEAVFNSASALYYDAKFMNWIVDKVPDQSILNTAGWRFIIPQLYKKYPNADMDLNITLPAPPVVQISQRNIDATVYADVFIDVLEHDDRIPVACISLVIRGSGSVHILGNNLAGNVKLDDMTMVLKWSKIGNLHMFLVQPVMWVIVETVFVPYANARLGRGFPLPIIRGFTLQNAEIICSNSRITVCSNVTYADSFDPSLSLFSAL